MGNTRNGITAAFGILAVIAVLGVLTVAADTTSVNLDDRSTEIMLKSRQFVPDTGLNYGVKSKLEVLGEVGVEKTHVLMQFYQVPDRKSVV